MGGAVPTQSLGLFYLKDPTGERHPHGVAFVHSPQSLFRVRQVLVGDGDMYEVVAECLCLEDAEAVVTRRNNA